MNWVYNYLKRPAPVGLILSVATSCISNGQAELTFEFGRNNEEDQTIEFRWTAAPDLVLQRSSTLRGDNRETLLASRGQAAFSASRQGNGTMF